MNIDFGMFAACQTEREVARVFGELEEYMTPLELGVLWARRNELATLVRQRLGIIVNLAPFAGQKLQQFHRVSIHPDVTLYRGPRNGTARKKLIVAFCGARNRLDMPLAAVLQSLPSRAVDIVVLRDRKKQHYLAGIDGYAADFHELARAIVRDLRPEKYSQLYSYGTSMGGFAAVRLSLLVPIRRAISMVGSFPGSVRRLIDRQQVPAFDPLCDCMARRSSAEVISVYGEGCGHDRRNSEWLVRICGAKEMEVPQVTIHNVAYTLAVSGRFPAFFAEMFELEGASSGAGRSRLGLSPTAATPIVSAA